MIIKTVTYQVSWPGSPHDDLGVEPFRIDFNIGIFGKSGGSWGWMWQSLGNQGHSTGGPYFGESPELEFDEGENFSISCSLDSMASLDIQSEELVTITHDPTHINENRPVGNNDEFLARWTNFEGTGEQPQV